MSSWPRLLLASLLALLVLTAGCSAPATVPPPLAPAVAPVVEATATAFPVTATATAVPASATPLPSATATAVPASATPLPSATATAVPASATPLPSATATPSPLSARSSAAYPTLAATPTPTVLIPPVSGIAAWQHVAALAGDLGPRSSNTEASLRGAEYVLSRLSAMGYDARLEPYSFSLFQNRSTELLLTKPDTLEIVAGAFTYTGRGSVGGPLVDCGVGRAFDFPSAGLRGKVGLIGRGGGTAFQDKVANAVRAGAAAVIIYNDQNGDFRGALAQQAAVPVVGISQFDGQRLQERLRQGETAVSLKVDAYTETRQGNNVVASSTGTSSRRRVVIGAHHDSVPNAPGANDNASGAAVLLELARALRTQKYSFDLSFVAFGDEEVGLVGSQHYLQSLSNDQRGRILAMINLDMVGVGSRMEFGGDQDLVKRGLRIAQQIGYPASEMGTKVSATSDQASFQLLGIPAVFLHRAEDPNYHSAQDTPDRVLPANLEAAGKVALLLLDELSRSN